MMLGCKTPDDVIKAIKDQGVEMVDLRFIDLPGHVAAHLVPGRARSTPTAFEEGLGFDGSSIRGWQAINESDMLLMPDATTAFIDPFCEHTTLVLICDIRDPITKEYYSRDPRDVARKAEELPEARPASPTPPTSAPRPSSSSSTTSATTRTSTTAPTTSTRSRATGTRPRTRARTSATRSAPRRATSRCRPPTRCRTSAPRWC